jgi:hypothetical protein
MTATQRQNIKPLSFSALKIYGCEHLASDIKGIIRAEVEIGGLRKIFGFRREENGEMILSV